jgi:hypothetical protein
MQMQCILDMGFSENSKSLKYVRNTELNLLSFSEMIDRKWVTKSIKAWRINRIYVVPG